MRQAAKIQSNRRAIACSLVVCLALFLLPGQLMAGQVSVVIPVTPDKITFETGYYPLAYGSDSVYCGGRLLSPGDDYKLNTHTGRLTFTAGLSCDTVIFRAFQIPSWLASPAGNRPSQGKRLLAIKDFDKSLGTQKASPHKITLSGNKSFSFTVGRSGDGRFSQGLNVDFDARLADDLRIRGSVSDRGGSGNQFLAGEGGTLILSELDKYFFEIEAGKVTARGGDITVADNQFLPPKRLKGIHGAFTGGAVDFSADVGRPAGRFVSRSIMGIDGRQGPYQAVGENGLPTGVVPGSEKVYLDGRLLEGGADRHYEFDYPSGRITFSPRVLITSRSRIEIDFEAAAGDYEQVVYDAATEIRIFDGKLKFSAGGRRETDDENKLRFGSLSGPEIEILNSVGDRPDLAFSDGAAIDTAGDYQLVIDTTGIEYYEYVGSGAGQYSVSFSYVGEGKGNYRYLGDGVYQYAGQGAGDYLPVRYLPLPSRNDFFYSALEINPYSGGSWRLEYQGSVRDNNLLSGIDDGDNFKSRLVGRMSHKAKDISADFHVRFRQDDYNSLYRLDPPDDSRIWAAPTVNPGGDELRLHYENIWRTKFNIITAEAGYISYKDNLRSQRMELSGQMLNDKAISPRFEYLTGNSEKVKDSAGEGLYEKYGAGVSVRPVRKVRVDLDFDRELSKNNYDSIPDIERYRQYKSAVFVGKSVLSVSRREEYRSANLGYEGPLQDKIQFASEESFGRLQVSLDGTWFQQKKLDSDRDDRTERLFATNFRYSPASAWMTLQAEYRQNRQSVRSTGFRYIRVNSGEGDYRFEDGVYLYDPDGDYIRIREEQGDNTSVSIGGKNHNITVYPGRLPVLKRYRDIFSQVAFRLRTEVFEEMPGDDRRTLSWILPWASRSGIEYIRRTRREKYSCLLFPAFNFYIVNLSYGSSFEEQESGSALYRSDREYDVALKNRLAPAVHTQLRWQHRRRDEFGLGSIALDLDNNSYDARLIINPDRLQLVPGVSYLQIKDARSGGEADGVVLSLETVWRQAKRGEVRFNTELRSLDEKIPFSQPEYLVTDGRRFGQSAYINLVVNYEIGKSWRLTVNLTDRIYEDRSAEFVGRGELIARF